MMGLQFFALYKNLEFICEKLSLVVLNIHPWDENHPILGNKRELT